MAGAAYAQTGQTAEESPAAGGKKGKEKTTQQAEPKAPKTQGATGAEQGAGAERGRKGKGNAPGAMTKEQGATGAATTETGAGKGKRGRGAKTETSATGAGTESATGASGQMGAGATTETGAGGGKGKRGRAKAETSAAAGATGTGAAAETGAGASVAPTGKRAGRGEKGMKGGANAQASAVPSMAPATAPIAAPSVAATGATGGTGAMGATGQQTTANTNVAATGGTTTHVEKEKVQQVKQNVQQIKQRNVNFRAQPRPDRVQAVTFNQNYRISGAERWSGPQYEVFRSYHPERHDQGWYHSHYQRVELIAGGYYFWNAGYWYPAWGYDSGHEYYAYDAPIYVGHRAEPPDRVIADVQAALQEMGYYRGEVDGLLGPLTREALTAYQADQGLQVTAVIDQPTLDSLEMG